MASPTLSPPASGDIDADRRVRPAPRLRVYVVEDEALIAMEIADRLRELGYDVCGRAATGERALEEIPEARADIVLMDIRLAGLLTGVETTALLRPRVDVPVVFLSAFSDRETIDEAVRSGSFGYLVKPFEERELHATLQAAYYRHRAEKLSREDARRQADMLRRTGEIAHIGAWELEIPSMALTWTPEIFRIHEIDPSRQPTLAEATECYAVEARPQIRRILREAIEQGLPWDAELPAVTRSGRPIWVRSKGEVERVDGKVARLIGTTQDITDRRAAAQALAEKDRLLAILMSTSHEGLWFIDTEARTLDVNPAMCVLLGRPREDVIGRPAYDFLDAANAEIFRREQAERRDGKVGAYQITLTRPDGSVVHCVNNATPTYDPQGRPSGAVGTLADITALVEARDRLAAQTRVFEAMVRAMPDGVMVSGADGQRFIDNDRLYELFGVDPATARATSDPLLYCLTEMARRGEYGPGDPEALARARRDEILGELAGKGEITYEKAFKHGRWIQAHLATIAGGGRVSIYRDVSERRERERELAYQSELLQTIFSSMGEGISVFDSSLRLAAWNDRYPALTGSGVAGLRPGIALRDVLLAQTKAGEFGACPDPEAEVERRLSMFWTGQAVFNERERPDGSIIETRRNPIPGGGFVTLYVDVTARHAFERQLAESNQLLDMVIENIPAMVFLKRADDLRYARFNRAGEALLGIRREDVIGRTDQDLFPAEIAEAFTADDRATLDGSRRLNVIEEPVQDAAGALRWLRTAKIALHNRDGLPTHLLGISIDITERKRAEEAVRAANETLAQRVEERTAALAASEERLRRIIDTALDGVIMIDAAGVITGWNPQAEAIFGWSADEALGRDLSQLIIPERDRGRHEVGFRHFRDSAETPVLNSRIETTAVRRDGGEIKIALSMTGFVVQGERCFTGFVNDITARKAAETELQTTRVNLQDAIDSMRQALVLFDKDDRLVVFNEGFASTYPAIRDLLVRGARFEDLFRAAIERGALPVPDGMDAEAFVAQRLADHRRADRPLVVVRHPSGRVIEAVERRARNGGVLWIGTDITDRVGMEQQLREAQKMEAIGKLTGGMAHDFNNYLGTIIGNLDLAKEQPGLTEMAGRLIEAALAGALSAAELTQSLLAFARRQSLDPRVTDVNQRIAAVAGLLARTLGEDVELVTDLAPAPWPVKIDGAQLDSCIVNLANNARDAMPRGGSLAIATYNAVIDADDADIGHEAAPGDYVVIQVSDTGEGMSAETLENVFEPFFTTKGPGHGTGLGLSMVYGFVKQSGGHIKIYSELGHGTVIRIYLPREHVAEAGTEVAEGAAQPALPGGSETVLVVEDNDQMRSAAVAQLGSLGYRVMDCATAAAALDLLADPAHRVDLLFTDVLMPGGLDGHGLAVEARARTPGLRVLLTSGFPGEHARRDDFGALPLLGKPYRKADLAAAVRAALDGAAG